MNTEEIKKIQKITRIPLFLPSIAYGGILNIRNLLYDKNILKAYRYENIKIISVGNIAAGGVGKTPVVINLANALKKYGKVCVVTGNYPTKDKRVNVVSLEGSIFKKPNDIPDEAYMIAKKTDVTVISSKSRKAAIELSIGLKMKYVILDDALHKRDIKKDIDICVFNKNRPFEDGFYIPAGTLRDAKSSVKRCDIKICVDKLETESYANSIQNCHVAIMKPIGIFNNKEKLIQKPKKVFAFCGIGNPNSFIKSLKNMNIEVVGYKFFNDHHIYTQKELSELLKLKQEKNAEILVTTYKDFVKIENENVFYLDVELAIEQFDKIIERII